MVAPEGATILEAAQSGRHRHPHPVLSQGDQRHRRLPHLRSARSRVPAAWPPPACCPVSEGMEVFTNTPKVLQRYRKHHAGADPFHPPHATACPASAAPTASCSSCAGNTAWMTNRFTKTTTRATTSTTSMPHLVRDNTKCILCRRCVAAVPKEPVCGCDRDLRARL